MFSETERWKILRFEVICYIPGNFEAGNSLNLNCCNRGRSTLILWVTTPCYPLTSEQCCLLRDSGA